MQELNFLKQKLWSLEKQEAKGDRQRKLDMAFDLNLINLVSKSTQKFQTSLLSIEKEHESAIQSLSNRVSGVMSVVGREIQHLKANLASVLDIILESTGK